MRTTTYVRRLGAHHFALLRSVAEGLALEAAAERYLGTDTKAAARLAYRQLVDQLRGVARRVGDRRWRLIGLQLKAPAGAERPSLEAWAAERGLDGWSQAELLEMYEEAFPADRKQLRAGRLRERQLQALRDLEGVAAERPQASDLLEGWFDDVTAERMKRAGLLTLGELQRLVQRGGRWYRAMPAIGAAKAARLASYLSTLLPVDTSKAQRVETYAVLLRHEIRADVDEIIDADHQLTVNDTQLSAAAALDGSAGDNRSLAVHAGTKARNDRQALEAWLLAKAGKPGTDTFVATTAKSYRLEGERLLLWCIVELGKPLSSMTAEDCSAYMAFLANIPDHWLSRRRAQRHGPGWTPFAGQLALRSRQHAVNVVAGLFDWLVEAKYLAANPWRLIKRRLGDDATRNELDSRAFTKPAWQALLRFVDAQPPSPSRNRARFMLSFCEATGLRASELLAAKLGQFRLVGRGWALPVHGKGARNRVVAVPGQAVRALEQYLEDRGLPRLGLAPADAPLVASADDSMAGVGYRSLYDSMKSWFRRAIRDSSLSPAEQEVASRASLHWLRHTCFTRALERKASLGATQRQAGHADPRTTMKYAKTQLEELQAEMEGAFE